MFTMKFWRRYGDGGADQPAAHGSGHLRAFRKVEISRFFCVDRRRLPGIDAGRGILAVYRIQQICLVAYPMAQDSFLATGF